MPVAAERLQPALALAAEQQTLFKRILTQPSFGSHVVEVRRLTAGGDGRGFYVHEPPVSLLHAHRRSCLTDGACGQAASSPSESLPPPPLPLLPAIAAACCVLAPASRVALPPCHRQVTFPAPVVLTSARVGAAPSAAAQQTTQLLLFAADAGTPGAARLVQLCPGFQQPDSGTRVVQLQVRWVVCWGGRHGSNDDAASPALESQAYLQLAKTHLSPSPPTASHA